MESQHNLKTAITYLKGVGPQREQVIQKELGLFTFQDLLYFFPFRYEDRTKFYKIQDLKAEGSAVQFIARVHSVFESGKGRGKRLTARVFDDTGSVELVWFKGVSWVKKSIEAGKAYVFYGKPTVFRASLNFAHPDFIPYETARLEKAGGLEPVYHSSEKLNQRGLHSKGIQKLMRNLLEEIRGDVYETLPPSILQKFNFPDRISALMAMHFPKNPEELKQARNRLCFEELFYLQLGLLRAKKKRQDKNAGHVFERVGDYVNQFYAEKLPFDLTGAQKRVLKEIRQDLKLGRQMNRLVQGDVGSGKTLVAWISALIALDNGFQSCLMAPTEILAQQHYITLQEYAKGLGIQVGILTGSTGTAARRQLLKGVKEGDIHILVGTHALLEDRVVFQSLGLAIIDEQHRFGVAQRAKLWAKGKKYPPHVLVMTATPIPRTLAMAVYGDLDISVIDEMPPGRKPIETQHYYESSRLKVWGFLKKEIEAGRQAYVVYPLIEESSSLDYKDLMEGYAAIQRDFPQPKYQVSVVHGKMKPEDKELEMKRFKDGETQIMVATTVIEVGVNVPNASIMVIESAERFGLSQLHQLRGRVGRGADQSYCFLMSGHKLSAEGRKRLETMVETNDGFVIADVDMQLRGPGDILGTRQSGMLDLKVANLSQDQAMVKLARNVSDAILKSDPNLELPEHARILKRLREIGGPKTAWAEIS